MAIYGDEKHNTGIITEVSIPQIINHRRASNKALRLVQKPVKRLRITVEWHRSRIWGWNPRASAEIEYRPSGFERRDGCYRCSGCGYDKLSTVVAAIFNDFLRYKLYAMSAKLKADATKNKIPYGIYAPRMDHAHYGYEGGIGMSCYPAIGRYIGGEMVCVAEGKSFDVWEYTDGHK